MHDTYLNVQKVPIILRKIFIIFYFFLYGCSTSQVSKVLPNQEERKKIENFLKVFLFEEGGAYTLFGDKPITDISFFIGTEDDICLDGLSKESLDAIVYEDDQVAQNGKVWKMFCKNLKCKNYLFVEQPSPFDPLHSSYCLVNIEAMKTVFEKYKEIFNQKTGKDLTFNLILDELQEPNSSLWNQIFQDHYLSGLLHGYGEENIKQFMKNSISIHPPATLKFSHEEDNTSDSISLPIYAIAKDDVTLNKYKKQREKIKKIYENQDFLEVTFRQLGIIEK